jgi:TolB-like protein
MKKNISVVRTIHGIALTVFLAGNVLSCGSPPPAPKEPEAPQKPAPVAEAQAVPEEDEIEELAIKYTLAILPFTGGDSEDGETIAELFSFNSTLNKVFAPMPRTSINRAISSEQKFQMDTGMTDPDTIIAIGKQLGAQYIVAGNITSLGNNKLLVISIIRIDRLQQVAGAIQTYTNIEEIQGKLPVMATSIARAVRIDASILPRLAIVPFQLRDSTNESDADVLAQILAINIVSSGAYAVYPRTATLEQVQDEYANQLSGDTADENLVDMGKGENPLFVLSGTARKLGATGNMFNASIIDLESGVQKKGASVDYQSLDDGIRAMRTLAAELTGANFTYTVTTAETFQKSIVAINAGSTGNYTITVKGDFSVGGITFTSNALKNITIRGDGSLRTISNSADSALFTIPDGISLVLSNNIRLNSNEREDLPEDIARDRILSLVDIAMDGMLRLETGAIISGNKSWRGGGVFINGGTFTMSGGTISGYRAAALGGGVYVNGGTFTMSGGTISGNRASSGGGVYVNGGTFIMSGGSISGNTTGYGGGVWVNSGMFVMSGGTISGNTADGHGGGYGGGGGVWVDGGKFTMNGGGISGNTGRGYGGGGVSVNGGSTFTMGGGTISGNKADINASKGGGNGGGVYSRGIFTKTGGTIDETNSASGQGKMVYVGSSRKRETAAGPDVNLDSHIAGRAGGWE